MASAKVCILQLNVEGLTHAKRDIILQLSRENGVNIILLQETHCESEEKLQIEGFDLICFVPHNKHGIASYVKQGLQVKSVLQSPENSPTQWITFEAMGIHFSNIYKPPPAEADFNFLPAV